MHQVLLFHTHFKRSISVFEIDDLAVLIHQVYHGADKGPHHNVLVNMDTIGEIVEDVDQVLVVGSILFSIHLRLVLTFLKPIEAQHAQILSI